MKNTCSHCSFLIDVSGLIPKSDLPDGISFRCMKEERFGGGWPLPIRNPEIDSCDEFIGFDAQRPRWEWDDAKNQRNVQKHGISFKDAVAALEADIRSIRLVSNKKWQPLDFLGYEE